MGYGEEASSFALYSWSDLMRTPILLFEVQNFCLIPIVYYLFSTDLFSLQPLEIVRSPSLPFCAKEQHAHWSHTYIIPKCYQCAALEICSCSSSHAIHVHNYSVLGACRYTLPNLFGVHCHNQFCPVLIKPQEQFSLWVLGMFFVIEPNGLVGLNDLRCLF